MPFIKPVTALFLVLSMLVRLRLTLLTVVDEHAAWYIIRLVRDVPSILCH